MLQFDRIGTGVPLVLIHAFPLSRSMWNVTKEDLSKNYEVITIDLPGFGGSPLTKETLTMEEMAKEVVLTINSLDLKEKFVLGGISMGGYVMFQVLKQVADHIRGLIFISTRSTPDTEEIRERRKRTIELVKEKGVSVLVEKMLPNLLAEKTIKNNPSVVEQVKDMILQAHPDSVCSALRGMAIRPDSTQFLQNINVPTMVMSGSDDVFTKPAEMSQMARLIPRARFESIPEAGHLIPLEKPDLFVDALSRYLKRIVL